MKTFNRLFIIWVIFATLIFAGLCTLGFVFKKNVEKYKEFEDVLVESTKSYVLNEGKVDFDADYLDVSINDLVKSGYLNKKDVVKSCSGKVRVKNKKQISYKAIIKCKNYKTK